MRFSERLLFLLGGHDLEMLEIRNILLKEGIHFIDLELQWGARLSRYNSFFQQGKIHVSIELIEDTTTPKEYIRIDHHNDLLKRPSSIEQVADLLGIELNRYQQLVSTNDTAYIPGLHVFGATKQEIEEIRRKDRAAQGVTEEDEKWAEVSITNHLEKIDGITTVNALTSKFSTITDRLYGKTGDKLLVWCGTELTFFGSSTQLLIDKFDELIQSGKAYAGGNPPGFFGLAPGTWEQYEVNEIRNQIIALLRNVKQESY